jgi:four helix bundle protein
MAVARRCEDLEVWQLSVELRDRIVELTESGPAVRNRNFVEQIQDSSASTTRNLAEGFGYFKPRQFARFARIARASLFETRNHLQDGKRRGYFGANDADQLLHLTGRAISGITSLLRYLDSCQGKAPTDWDTAAPTNLDEP